MSEESFPIEPPLPESKCCIVATAKHNDVWINEDAVRFAIVPDAEGSDVEGTMADVDALVASYVSGELMGEDKAEPIFELYDLHAQGRVLWPTGLQWHMSVLGTVKGHMFVNVVAESDQHCTELRNEIAESDAFDKKALQPVNRAYQIWRFFMTARLSTIGVNHLEEFDETLLRNVFAPMRKDGRWAPWIKEQHVHSANRLIKFMRGYLGRTLFGNMATKQVRMSQHRDHQVFFDTPHLVWITETVETWAETIPSMSKGMAQHVRGLLLPFGRTLTPDQAAIENFFSQDNKQRLLEFASTHSTPTGRALAVRRTADYAEWMVNEHAPSHLGLGTWLTRYDAEQFAKKQPPAPNKPSDVVARPMPVRFHHMLKNIIKDDDFAWPKSLKHAATGVPLHFFEWRDPATRETKLVFNEVLPRLLLLHLDIPLRTKQARRLDSGEGDSRVYDPKTGKWSEATGPHAGRWVGLGAKNPRRGVFREINHATGTITGMWINSNKTQDVRRLFDETTGYEIPWEHDEALANLAEMRAFQEKYNPVAGPLPYDEISNHVFLETPSALVRRMIPDRFYLFRYPQNAGDRGCEAPPSYAVFSQFFHDALEELENRLKKENPEDAIRIITTRARDKRPTQAIFSIHGMRASTLKSLHVAGVPIEILSKALAGHATVIMTLRYIKFDPAHVSQTLNDARAKALSEERTQFANMLRSMTIENAVRMTARLTDDGLRQAKGPFGEPAGWIRSDIGICPNGSRFCDTGGPVLKRHFDKDGTDKSAYGPVPGGSRNCVRCRFFITGLPFLNALWMHGVAILAKIDGLSKRIAELQEEENSLKERQARGELIDRNRKKMVEETWMADDEVRDQALADLHATMVLTEKVQAIARQGSEDGKLPMLIEGDVPEITGRASTRFELVDAVVQGSRWFPSINSVDLERERDEFLNKILYNNGYVPITMAPLSQHERRRAADALAQLILVELGSSEAQHLIEGRRTLADLGLQDRLEFAVARAVGKPLDRLSLSSCDPSVSIGADWSGR